MEVGLRIPLHLPAASGLLSSLILVLFNFKSVIILYLRKVVLFSIHSLSKSFFFFCFAYLSLNDNGWFIYVVRKKDFLSKHGSGDFIVGLKHYVYSCWVRGLDCYLLCE